MNPSWPLSYGTVRVCVLQWLSWTGSLNGHCVHLRAAVTCEGFFLPLGVHVIVLVVFVVDAFSTRS